MATSGVVSSPRSSLTIETLRPEDVDRLHFGIFSRSTATGVRAMISAYPGRSVWVPETLEYAIVAPWRHRLEVANVHELSAARHPTELLADVVRRSGELGAALVLNIELDETRHPAFYDRAGFSLLEEVVTYELLESHWVRGRTEPLTFAPADASDSVTRSRLLEIDHAAFPWLWWNNEAEFIAYAESPGVELYFAHDAGVPIGYIGVTSYLGWGHLDRIAILPELQGRGYGRAALEFAIERLVQLGARHVGLSTQHQNVRSRRLYERTGFRHVPANDYRLYGRILRLPAGVPSATALI